MYNFNVFNNNYQYLIEVGKHPQNRDGMNSNGVIAHDFLRDEDGFIKKRPRVLIRPV
jgi:hypothetical protein